MNRQKILTVFQIIGLVLLLVCAVELLYNAIDMFKYTTDAFIDRINSNSAYFFEPEYKDGQKPLSIITLVSAIFAFAGAGAGISSLFVKNKICKTVCLAISAVAVVACLALIIAVSCVWSDFFDKYGYQRYSSLKPDIIPTGYIRLTSIYTMYSGVMALLIQQLVYTAIFTAPLIANYVIDLKSAKAQETQPAEEPAETEKENI